MESRFIKRITSLYFRSQGLHTRIYSLQAETIVLLIQQMNVKDFIINLYDFKGDWHKLRSGN